MKRQVSFAEGEYYHIYNRGANRANIFLNDGDRIRFMVLLYLCNSSAGVKLADELRTRSSILELFEVDRKDTLVDIGAYVLMPNHFHILVHEKSVGGLSLYMKKLCTAYSMYFNKKYERSGTLFEGRFKAQHANTDEYLKYLYSYIHLNPIKLYNSKWKETGISDKKRAKNFLNKYRFSSFLDYSVGERTETIILNSEAFPKYFKTRNTFQSNIDDWLMYSKQE